MRKTLIILVSFFALGLTWATTAEAAPLRTSLKTVDGKGRIEVKKKLPLLVSCSKECAGKLTLTLVTSDKKYPVSGNVSMEAGDVFRARYLLTAYGIRYVRKNIGTTKLVARFSAVDLENNRRSVKTRTFRFYK